MKRPLSLAHLTALPFAPPQLVRTAATIGYDFVGVRMLSPAPGVAAYPLMDDKPMLRETLAVMNDTGIQVFDIEVVRLSSDFDSACLRPFLETGAALGARAILVAGDDKDPARLAHSFACLCDEAKSFGMTANIEFMPWTAVTDLQTAKNVVADAGTPSNAGIIVDAIHYERSATTLDQVKMLPESLVNYVQLSDSPAGIPASMDEILRQARYERLLPGEGGIDLQGLIHSVPEKTPLSVEVWDERRSSAVGIARWAELAFQATKSLLA